MSNPGTRLVRRETPALDVAPRTKRAKRRVVATVTPFSIFAVARLDAALAYGHPLQVAWDGATLTIYTEGDR